MKKVIATAYEEERQKALSIKAEDVGFPNLKKGNVYAAVVDISHDDGTATLACTLRGDVEFYHSSGKVYKNLCRDENVKNLLRYF